MALVCINCGEALPFGVSVCSYCGHDSSKPTGGAIPCHPGSPADRKPLEKRQVRPESEEEELGDRLFEP